MKLLKRLFIILIVFIILIIGAVFAIPYFFKDDIIARVKTEINNTIEADVDFTDVDLSIFSSFPHLSFGLHELTVTGRDQFEGLQLVSAKHSAFVMDIMSVINSEGAVEIRSVELDEPNIHVVVLADGMANYDIVKASEEEEEAAAEDASFDGLLIELQSFSINNGGIIYKDIGGDMEMAIAGLNHQSSGNFTLDIFDLDTETSIDKMTFGMGGMNYLKDAKLNLDAIFNINMPESLYTLKDNELTLNELTLNADGSIQLTEEDINLDLVLSSPETDFKSLWSLIPNAYTADYSDVDVQGEFAFDGMVQGTYNENTYPAFSIKTNVDNGKVKYPDLPMSIDDIKINLDIKSPSSDLNEMVISAPHIGLKVGSDPFKAKFSVTTPISDPNVDAFVDGTINLAQWAKAFPMEGIDELTGKIVAKIDMKTRLSTIEQEDYENVKMEGQVSLSQLAYRSTGLPAIIIEAAAMDFSPQRVAVNNFEAKLGKSDIKASGSIDNILAYISPEKTMKGSFTAHSNYFNADEWMTEEETTTTTYNAPPPAAPVASEEEIFDRFDFDLIATSKKIEYDVYTLTNTDLAGRVKANYMSVDHFSTQIGESDLRGSGTVTNAFEYLFNDGVLGGDLNLGSNYFNLNQFMVEEEATTAAPATEEAYSVIPVPGNIDMTLNARMDEIQYTDIDIKNMNGKLVVRDESVVIEDGSGDLLGGSMKFAGAYDTKDIEAPYYRFMYDMNKIDFQKSFGFLNTFEKLAPIGKYVQGNFSSNMMMEGTLGEDMMPKLTDINAEGLLETLDASLANFKPLMAVGNALKMESLKENINIDNLKTWFTVKKGMVEVEPFNVVVADLPMTIVGKHGLDQSMDYKVNTVIPRSALENNALGNTVNQGVSALLSQASNLGLNINDAENINVQINITGSVSDPKIGFKLLGADGESSVGSTVKEEATALVQDQIDDAKEDLQNQVDETRDKAKEEANRIADSLRNAATAAAEQAGQDIRDRIVDQIGGGNSSDSTKTDGQKAVEDIKEGLKDFNPFKRRNRNKNNEGEGGESGGGGGR